MKKFGFISLIIVSLILVVGGCVGNEQPSEQEEQIEKTNTVTYDGSLKIAGQAVQSIDGSNILIDALVDPVGYTDIIIGNESKDLLGETIKPGEYEFQFVEFPEQGGSWYLYLETDSESIKISGNPNGSDSGKIYTFKEGDTISIDNVSVATFYRIAQ
jgi:hypothetical protein